MNPGSRFVLIVLLVLMGLPGPAIPAEGQTSPPSRFDADKFMSSADIREGMKGYGLTVFQGTRIERFEVEILGVLRNEYSGSDMILGRCTGGPLAKTGVIAGMSGSPVYIEQGAKAKLIGAVAYAWTFSTDSIAGITPIEKMLPVIDLAPTERAFPAGAAQMNTLNSRDIPQSQVNPPLENWEGRLSAFLRKDAQGALGIAGKPALQAAESPQFQPAILPAHSSWTDWWQAPLKHRLSGNAKGGWVPLATPLSLGGVSNEIFDQVAGLFPAAGLQPSLGGTAISAVSEPVHLEPGSSLGVALITGDLNATAIGTTTYMDGGKVIGFGHPMFQDGPTDLPMTTAYITTVMPSSMNSFKMGGLIEIVGALEQDRFPAVGGVIGAKPTLVPFKVNIRNQAAGIDRDFTYEIILHRFFTPRFGMMCVLDAFDAATRAMRDTTTDYTLTIHLKGRAPVVIRDQVSSAMGTSFELAMTFSAAVDLVLKNPYEQATIEAIELKTESVDRLKKGTLEWIQMDRQEVELGQSLKLQMAVRPWMGELQTFEKAIAIPKEFPVGPLLVTVNDAAGYIGEMQRRNPDRFRPRSMDDLLRLLNEVYRNDQVFVTLSALAPGASFNGREMPNLPSSVLRVMAESTERGTGQFLANRPLLTETIQASLPVSGSQMILVNVQPSQADRLN